MNLIIQPGDSEHSKADSISWHAIRLAVTKLCIGQMEEFLRVAGVEPQGIFQNPVFLSKLWCLPAFFLT